ncbi:hypothetical protein BD779DRAFT_1791347 [Infundibulicybe gibba]|nr:hypothetical protein BD779DRAFT_1791347 [Infundibulicybe gibba]
MYVREITIDGSRLAPWLPTGGSPLAFRPLRGTLAFWLWIELTCLRGPGDGTSLPSHICDSSASLDRFQYCSNKIDGAGDGRKCAQLVITVPTSAAQLPHSYELNILGFQRFRTAGRGYAGDVVPRSSWSGALDGRITSEMTTLVGHTAGERRWWGTRRESDDGYYQGKGTYARLWVVLICNMRDGPTNGSHGPWSIGY